MNKERALKYFWNIVIIIGIVITLGISEGTSGTWVFAICCGLIILLIARLVDRQNKR